MKRLTTSMQDYIKVRRLFGYQLKESEQCLKQFISFLKKKNSQHITIQLALEWAMIPQNVKRSHWARRLSIIRIFSQYRKAEDPRTEIPPSHLLKSHSERISPYIYNDEEIRQLLESCKTLKSQGIRHHTYFIAFGLLMVTGCRIGELVALNREDIDLNNAWITIRNAKCNKSRLLPLHKSTVKQLKKYCVIRDRLKAQKSTAFFLSDKGLRISVWSTRYVFIQLSKQIGLRGQLDTHGPRIHDIRHTFAVNTLLNWYREGIDVDQNIMLLSTYLGHKKPSDTYWYLTGVPELLAKATTKYEKEIGEWS